MEIRSSIIGFFKPMRKPKTLWMREAMAGVRRQAAEGTQAVGMAVVDLATLGPFLYRI